MMRNAEIIILLRSYVQNFPILFSWENSVRDCIALQISNMSNITDIVRAITRYPVIITSTDSVAATKKKLFSPNVQAAFLLLSHRKKGRYLEKEFAKIKLFQESAFLGSLDGKKLEFPLFFIVEGLVPEVLADTYIVNFSDEKCVFDLDYYEKIPSSQELFDIKSYTDQQKLCESQRPMVAAAAFLKPYYKKHHLQSEFCNIRNFAENILEEYFPSQEICDCFCDIMIRKAQNGFLEDVIYLPTAKKIDSKTLDENFFSDMQGKIFMTDGKFSEIVDDILREVSITQLKAALKEKEILISYGNEYTSKMSYPTENGGKKRATMIQLDADKIVNVYGYKLSYKLIKQR